MKVLVVDDDPHLVDSVSVGLQLQVQDCAIVTAGDGDGAVRSFEDEAPNIVLLDVGLDGTKTGFDVLRHIRRVSDVPVIMLTGHSEELEQVKGLEMGADDYVIKPVCYASACRSDQGRSSPGRNARTRASPSRLRGRRSDRPLRQPNGHEKRGARDAHSRRVQAALPFNQELWPPHASGGTPLPSMGIGT